jgi:hypothetical protein
MNFQELVDEVYLLTNRPDMIGQTQSAIKAATLKAHHLDFFSKDIYEDSIKFDSPHFRQQWDYINTISNYRALKYFRKSTDACDTGGAFIKVITPEELLNAYGCEQTDIAYVAGRCLEIKSSTEFQYAYIAAYVHPIVAPSTDYCSWVAEFYPYAIVYEAARVIFKTIGFDEESAQYNSLVLEEYALLKLSALPDVGS